jgi:hypothetical protein
VRVKGLNNRARSFLRRTRAGIWHPARSKGGTIMSVGNIVVTESDYVRLLSLVRTYRRLHQCDTERLDELENELNRATIVNLNEVPADVVTMNSRV